MKNFQTTMIAITAIAIVTFIALIGALLQRGSIEFTTDDSISTPIIYPEDPMNGSQTPNIVVVFYGDFTSDYSADIYEHLQSIMEKYPENIMLVWKDFPNTSLRSESYNAAIAAQCAEDQHSFFTYGGYLMSHQHELSPDLYLAIAQELNLREGKFERCVKKQKTANRVDAGITQAEALSLASAPTVFINDVKYTGSMTYSEIERIIESYLE